MAKSLTSRQQEQTRRGARGPIVLVKLTTYSDKGAGTVDAVYYLSTHPVVYDYGNTGTLRYFRAAVIGLDGTLTSVMPHLPQPRGGASSDDREVTLVLSQQPLDAGSSYLVTELRSHNLEFATVEIAELDRDLAAHEGADLFDLRSLTGDEHVVWGRLEVSHVGRVDDTSFSIVLRPAEPEIPSRILSDAANNDPKDLGKRLNVVVGANVRVPCHGVTVGWYTTLAQEITASTTGNVKFSDAAGFSGSFTMRIAGEEVSATAVDETTVNITARAQNGTAAAAHLAGTIALEIVSTAKWAVAGIALSAVNSLWVESPFNGELVRIETTALYSVNTGDTVSGDTATTVSITAANLRTLLNSLEQQAIVSAQPSVTQQPVVSHDTTDVVTEQSPTSGDANLRDWDTSTSQAIASDGTVSTSVTFPNPSGTVLSQYVYVDLNVTAVSASGAVTIQCGAYSHNLLVTGRRTVRLAATTDGTTTISCDGSGIGETRATVYEVWRDVFYNPPAPSLTTNTAVGGAAIAAAEFGFGLRLWADCNGPLASGGNYSVSNGTLIEHPADVLRWLIADHCGKGHGAIDSTSFAAAVTNLGSGYKLRANLLDLGDVFSDVAGRLAFEACANLVNEEGASASVYRMLTPSWDGGTKLFKFSTTGAASITSWKWDSIEEQPLDRDSYYTRFSILYDRDPFLGADEESFRKAYRADKVTNDLSSQIATADFTAAEARYGRRDHPGFGLLCVADDASAKFFGGYMAQEHMRLARILAIDGLDWSEVYDRECGDLVIVTAPWDSGARYYRLIEHQHSLGDSGLSVVGVEVLT